MSLIIPANTLASGGYDVANSCRFDGSSSSLNLAPSSGGSVQKFTFSCWFKRCIFGTSHEIFSHVAVNNNTDFRIFISTDSLRIINQNNTSDTINYVTNRLFRDPSAWYHIVVAIDTTDSTAGDRVKVYVNGIRETSFSSSTAPSVNENLQINGGANTMNFIGQRYTGSGSIFFNGYMAEVVYVNGTANAVTDFGEFDEDSGIWKPIDVSGLTFGTNGFYLDFEDSANLGNDASGGTDFTENGLAAIDQTTDTPTNNFCTMNPLDNFYIASTFSEGNCKVVTGSSSHSWNTSTFGLSSGKWYMEFTIIDAGSGGSTLIGITDRPAVNASEELGGLATTYAYLSSGKFRTNNTNTANSVSSTNGDIIGVALDLDSSQNTISYYKNNTLIVAAQNITAPVSGNYFIASGDWLDGDTVTNDHNFGNPVVAHSSAVADGNSRGSFEYAPPSGYLSICTANLSEVLG